MEVVGTGWKDKRTNNLDKRTKKRTKIGHRLEQVGIGCRGLTKVGKCAILKHMC